MARPHWALLAALLVLAVQQGVAQETERQVRTLHIHSKIVERLVRPFRLRFWVLMGSLPFPVLVKKKRGVARGVLLKRLLIGRGLTLVKAVNRLFPSQTALVMNYLSETSARPLSKRQADVLNSMFLGSYAGQQEIEQQVL